MRISMHTPGHKNRLDFSEFIDTTELDYTDNLYEPKGILKKAQEKAAKLVGAKHTYFLTNGATAGILTMFGSLLKPHDKILMFRDCHFSAVSALIHMSLEPIFISDIEEIKIYPDIKAVFVTSPNYYGFCRNIKTIADITRKANKILMVDEAHGAHFGYHSKLPQSAVKCGAGLVVQSAHKTLPALTQSAFLHSNLDFSLIKYLKLYQTSSPSYLLMGGLDECIEIMRTKGHMLLDRLIMYCEKLRENINKTKHVRCLVCDDKTRLVFSFKRLTGHAAAKILARHSIDVEMSDSQYVVCIPSVFTTKEELKHLEQSIISMTMKKNIQNEGYFSGNEMFKTIVNLKLDRAMTPRDAFYSKTETVNIDNALNKVSADTVYSYPPGVPVIIPGEVISKTALEHAKTICNKNTIEVVC